jgi:hypothetical protein
MPRQKGDFPRRDAKSGTTAAASRLRARLIGLPNIKINLRPGRILEHQNARIAPGLANGGPRLVPGAGGDHPIALKD